ncbi:FAS1-like dehydratase domain-containing protein [Ornithinicoccus halotolerans]|uniref:FAS1-like dehydratase domain-containing protein n=1 Tax=Ornithinicoccus halotolerans TaxID=1748220 RepID=UPI001294FA0B|nr:MaoC family dehydratase N-terminal domain-containing protein [Ornithinicoccus halotolerans]
MGVNTAFQGRSYPPTEPYLVERSHVAAFADAVGAGSDLHRDPEAARAAGYADVVAPPTYAVVVAQRCDAQLVQDPEAGIDFSRVVHGSQAFAHHRPLVAGDRVVGTLHVDTVREAGGHAMVTTRSELATPEGEPLCTATSTIVVRGQS